MAIDKLPSDKMMLLSFVNTRLRDDGITLKEFCTQFEVEESELISKLKEIDYEYNEELNRFV